MKSSKFVTGGSVAAAFLVVGAVLARYRVSERQVSSTMSIAALLTLVLIGAVATMLLVKGVERLGTIWGAFVLSLSVTISLVNADLLRFFPLVGPLWSRSDPSRHILALVELVVWWCFTMMFARFLETRAELRAIGRMRRVLEKARAEEKGPLELLGASIRAEGANTTAERRAAIVVDNKTAPERVVRLLAAQADSDVSLVEMSYGPLRALVWALPALGFIGTAAAMAASIGGIGAALNGNVEGQAHFQVLTQIVPHLADAFSITLVALSGTVVCFFVLSMMHRREQHVLTTVDGLAMDLFSRIDRGWARPATGDPTDRLFAELWSLEQEISTVSGQMGRLLDGRGYAETLSKILTSMHFQLRALNESARTQAELARTLKVKSHQVIEDVIADRLADILRELQRHNENHMRSEPPRTSGVSQLANTEDAKAQGAANEGSGA